MAPPPRSALTLLATALTLAPACGEGPSAGAANPAAPAAADVAAAGPPEVFHVYGLPGPWWQPGGLRDGFERDTRACRDESSAAREAARDGDHRDAAYRAFVGCMQAHSWQRGSPPPGTTRPEES